MEVNLTLQVVAHLSLDAVDIAASLDAERYEGATRGPLHGIPTLIKDRIATADKTDNTAGLYAMLDAKVPRDSTVAAKYRPVCPADYRHRGYCQAEEVEGETVLWGFMFGRRYREMKGKS